MLGLTPTGAMHAAIGVLAVIAGVICLLLDHEIAPGTASGRVYVAMTALACPLGLVAARHGGFGWAQVLALTTLLTLSFAMLAGDTRQVFGRISPYLATGSYSLTFLFHGVQGIKEVYTRVPIGEPLFASADDPKFKEVAGLCIALFLVGVALQLRRLHGELREPEQQRMPGRLGGGASDAVTRRPS